MQIKLNYIPQTEQHMSPKDKCCSVCNLCWRMKHICWMLTLATCCHTHYNLYPFHFVLFKFKGCVAKRHPTNVVNAGPPIVCSMDSQLALAWCMLILQLHATTSSYQIIKKGTCFQNLKAIMPSYRQYTYYRTVIQTIHACYTIVIQTIILYYHHTSYVLIHIPS